MTDREKELIKALQDIRKILDNQILWDDIYVDGGYGNHVCDGLNEVDDIIRKQLDAAKEEPNGR